MRRQRTKIIAASVILASAMAFLVVAGIKNTSIRHYTPGQLVANAAAVDNKGVQVDGLIHEGSPKWDAAEFKLTFAVRDREGESTVNVLYRKLKPDNFIEGGNVFVEGKYDAERNLITASKLMTKCASKYESAESAGQTTEY
ncbi:MAG: cytochrome c maturation protein CcmE [Candidatus Poribacteria bacterium]|nr:cytochrome c maturation protein CcmE [Candidatus Poribacteria bacterium]MDE0502635.1 cytochrome c maturation protein CcmE [Candidatus Poribacteria bacterium]